MHGRFGDIFKRFGEKFAFTLTYCASVRKYYLSIPAVIWMHLYPIMLGLSLPLFLFI